MYELEDTRAEAALAADSERGVDVRVILNSSYTRSDNDAAFALLQAHGVHVHWASSRYALTHQKTLVIDSLGERGHDPQLDEPLLLRHTRRRRDRSIAG